MLPGVGAGQRGATRATRRRRSRVGVSLSFEVAGAERSAVLSATRGWSRISGRQLWVGLRFLEQRHQFEPAGEGRGVAALVGEAAFDRVAVALDFELEAEAV